MHDCPECGQACHCGGDIDDAAVMSSEWIYWNCECCANEDCDDEYHDFSDALTGPYCQECGCDLPAPQDSTTVWLCDKCRDNPPDVG